MGSNLTERVRNTTAPGAEVAQQKPKTLGDDIREMEDQFRLAMPKGAEATQLVRDALTALRTTPGLLKCDRTTVLGGLMTCAQLGLRPGVLGHAWLIPFGNKAQLVIGYQGLVELAHRSGRISSLIARVVYEHDTFDVDYGLNDNLVHKPAMSGSRGKPVAYYAIAKYIGGGYSFIVMTQDEMLEYRDEFAKSKNSGPWRDNFEAMALKTTVRQLSKWMPKSTEFASAIAADETVRIDLTPSPDAMLHGEHPETIEGEIVEDQPEAAEQPTA